MAEEEKGQQILTKKDINNAWRTWWLYAEVQSNNVVFQGLSHMLSLMDSLRKLYPDDDDYREALKRNSQFYNTEGTIGAVVNGMTLSMEEERATGENVPDEVMYSMRTALMGPMAGIGDSLVWGTCKTISLSIATTFALSGNLLAVPVALMFPLVTYFIGRWLYGLGYDLGRTAVMNMLKSGIMDKIIMACGMLGLMVMGALSAENVALEIATEFTLENAADPISIQGMIDAVAPGLLPLAVIGLISLYLKKHNNKYGLLILAIIALSIVASFFGIV
ncbi:MULTISPECIES: PTS system mannose/fructose/sorbose family transporter subunit IID [unclassified Collinsella]|uniref:PTS system mannose/fructose/sorbose family transporter subunit IID n=1 Tax=unclassified Collinsella TaxID=2637548 RepID=UPI00319D9344